MKEEPLAGDQALVEKLYASAGDHCVNQPDVAHLEVHGDEVVGLHQVPGLEMQAVHGIEGLRTTLRVQQGARIAQPVRICFGLLPERGRQIIDMQVVLEDDASVAVLALCTFPNAVEVEHRMEADIQLGRGAEYQYLERHVHGEQGGLEVVPHAQVTLMEGARFRTDFELLRGRVGSLDIDYRARAAADAVLELSARIAGRADDRIRIHEEAALDGDRARGVLVSNVAVRDDAVAEIRNTLVAAAPGARGHVDCKEIVQDRAVARAIPEVEVRDPRAHVTHEAALGSVDQHQLETLMSRGLSEDEATEMIIEALLSPPALAVTPAR